MQVEQTFRVPFDRNAVWRCFHDTSGIVACLPGASLNAPPDDGKLKLTMSVKLGPIVAAFTGDGEMRLDDAAYQGSVSGAGSDRKSGSRVKGSAAFSLHEEAGASPDAQSTRVEVRVDYAIAGSLAQFSRAGIVQELASRLTAAFADNLKLKLEEENKAAAPAAPLQADTRSGTSIAAARPAAAAGMARNAPLSLGQLFWPMLLERCRRWFKQKPKH